MPCELPAGHPLEHELARCREAVEQALSLAAKGGAQSAEASTSLSSGYSVQVRMGEVDTLQHARDRSLGVTVYRDGRKGSATSSDFSASAIAATVEAALAAARYTEPDPHAGLVDAEELAQHWPDLELHHPWSWTPEAAIEQARAMEATGRAVDARLTNSDGAGLSWGESVYVLGNSNGFLGGYASSRGSASCTLIARDADGNMQRDGWYASARAPEDLPSLDFIGRMAGERAAARLGARRLPTGPVPVIYEYPAAMSLVNHLLGAIAGSAVYRRTTFLLDRVGTTVFPGFIDIREAPHIPRGAGSAPFDGDGVATRDRLLVEGGVLNGLLLSGYSARRLGLRTTGNAGGAHNVVVTPGEEDLAGLMRRMGRGLLVTDLMGFGVNATTGDYSRGAAGFWVEDGEIAYPVEEITIASNLKDMFLGIQAVGSDVDPLSRIRTGSMLIDRMTVAGG
jgi:PmbA protein